ncbi:MAG: hypothetical protein COA32_09055 [Fluviicola sp.]|nr:MAG: hypothetical protein COA32_09055 [Fluviicola sp.]
MKQLLILLFLLFSFSCFPQDSSGKKISKNKVLVKEYYENGQLKAKGKKKRCFKVHSVDGRSCGIMSFFKHGRWTHYYANGQKKSVEKYKKGEFIKLMRSWNEDGTRNKELQDS